jgi:F-type H+-transporting ATPase subunit delta
MAETATIARPYAEAAFALADAQGALGRWSQMLAAMAQVAAHPEVRAATGNPNLGADQIYALFAGACGDLTLEAQNLLRLLIENDRLGVLPEIHGIYEELKNEREGVVDALITTARPLEPSQLEELVAAIEARVGRKVKPRVEVDAELIGGARVQVGDEVIEGSVRGKLDAMATALLK